MFQKFKYMKKITIPILLIIIFIFSSCGPKGLDITEDKEIRIPQRGSKTIKGAEGDIEIILGDITMGAVSVQIKSIDDDKVYLKTNMSEGQNAIFQYTKEHYYRVKINSFEEHIFHDDIAFISFRKVSIEKGKAEAPEITKNTETKISGDEIRTYLNKIKNSKLKFIRNGEILNDSSMANHLEAKYILNQNDIKTKEDFFEKIVCASMMTKESYKVIVDKDTMLLKSWLDK